MANLIAREYLIAVSLMTVGYYIRTYWSDVKGTSYAPVGYNSILRATGQRFGCNMIPAITPKGTLAESECPLGVYVENKFNAPQFVSFLQSLPPLPAPSQMRST